MIRKQCKMGRADIVPHGPFALAKIGSCAMLTLQEYKEAEADLLQRLSDNPGLEAFQIDDDVREFWHG